MKTTNHASGGGMPRTPFAFLCCLTRRAALLLALLLGGPLAGWAADLTGVQPVTNRVVQLTFVDGTIKYHTLGQQRYDDQVTLFAGGRLSTSQSASSYTISSTDDADFSTGRAPLGVGVNVRVEQTWAEDVQGRPTDVRTTAVYLYLPATLKRGKTYVISTGNLAANVSSVSLTFDEAAARSEAVHVNNLGCVPGAAKKYGYVYAWLGDRGGLDLNDAAQLDPAAGRGFRLVRTSDRATVFSGTYVFRKPKTQAEFGQWGTTNNNFTGADVYECDFSTFNAPGEYVLAVDGVGCSFPFRVGTDVYQEPFYWVMKSLYENRSGIELKTPYAQYNRPAPHRPGVTPGFHLYYSTARHYDLTSDDAAEADVPALDAGIKGELTDTWGWYQDAGDWDAYSTHAKVPAYLMALYDANPGAFNGLRLDIPESAGEPAGTALPDLLDEARWLPRFYKRLKDELQAKGWGTGGVGGGRVFGDDYNPELNAEIGKGSWQDTRKWVVTGEDPFMTYQYAALAAQLAAILQTNGLTDPEGVNWRAEAEAAWTWARNNTRAADTTPKWNYNLVMHRMSAAAALYRLTGDKTQYEASFITDLNQNIVTNGSAGIPDNFAFADDDDKRLLLLLAYQQAAKAQPGADAPTLARVAGILQASADYELGDTAFPGTLGNRAMRWGGGWWLPMGIGQTTTPYIQAGVFGQIALATANAPKAAEWLANSYTTADYFLGTNPLNMTMISGVGDRYPSQVFHMDSWYLLPNGVVKKGIIPYGNTRDCQDDLGGCGGYYAPYKYYYGLNKAYPAPFDATGNQGRPGHERYMPSRTSPLTNEFTVHQSSATGALVYGFLYAKTAPLSPSPTQPPTAGTGTGLRAEYFANTALTGPAVLSRVDAQVDFDWGTGSPGTGVNADNFSVRWEGQVEAPVSGAYTFTTVSDDGIRLWVNGNQVINNWTDHGPTPDNSSAVTLSAGQKYSIKLEYFENGGGAVARLHWSYPSQATAAIPATRLYPAGPGAADTQAPTAPTALVASAVTATGFVLSWAAATDNVGVSAYEVFRDGTALGTTASTTYSLSGLRAGTAYSLTVKAQDAAGNTSPSSAALSVTTSPATPGGGTPAGSLVIYGDAMAANWANPQGWGATTAPVATPVQVGSNSLRVINTEGWGGAYFSTATPVPISAYPGGIKTWLHGGPIGARLTFIFRGTNTTDYHRVNVPANTWQEVSIPWSAVPSLADLYEIRIGDGQDPDQVRPFTFYVDELRLVGGAAARAALAPAAGADRRAVVLAPNPTAGPVDVRGLTAGDHLAVYDVLGRCVHAETARGEATRLELGRHPAGVYVVRIRTAAGTVVRRLVRN